LSSLCLCALPAPGNAQEAPHPVPVPEVRGGTGSDAIESVLHVTYDVRRDRLSGVRASSAGALGFGTAVCFDNSDIKLPIDPPDGVAIILAIWNSERTMLWKRTRKLKHHPSTKTPQVHCG
jgi:hypothetical protein